MISGEEILIIAPTGADAKNIDSVLRRAQIGSEICRTADHAAARITAGVGALLVTEEALTPTGRIVLSEALDRQPPWSDLPIIVVASTHSINSWASQAVNVVGTRSNVTLVARPLQAATLVAAANTVLRARRRQYQIRDLLGERESLLGTLEQRVTERTAKLQDLVGELESFSYSVSHDLRGPLRVMAGYASVLLADHGEKLTPEMKDYVERIARAAERMDRLTLDVLAYTRLSRGQAPMGKVELEPLVAEIADQYPELATVRPAIKIRKPLAPVVAHGPVLAQALANLLGNAVKFARPGVPLCVEVFTRKSSSRRVQVVVKDNGIGIEPANFDKIFRIFERAVGHDVPGTGIGLAIVKKAAERMGGSVGVASRPGEGSEFWIELAAARKID